VKRVVEKRFLSVASRVAIMQSTDAVDMLPTVRIPGMVRIILPGGFPNVRPNPGILSVWGR